MRCKGMNKNTKHIGIEFWSASIKEKTFASTRDANSLMNSWSTIQPHTNKFVGFLASIEMTDPSGVNEQNNVKNCCSK